MNAARADGDQRICTRIGTESPIRPAHAARCPDGSPTLQTAHIIDAADGPERPVLRDTGSLPDDRVKTAVLRIGDVPALDTDGVAARRAGAGGVQ